MTMENVCSFVLFLTRIGFYEQQQRKRQGKLACVAAEAISQSHSGCYHVTHN